MNSAERHVSMTISPTRYDPAVLRTMATVPPTGDDPLFIQAFAQALRDLRTIMGAESGRSFILPGSGTLGMEAMVANWLEPGLRVLVVSTGYWGDRLAEIARHHGAEVLVVASEPGMGPNLAEIESELAKGGFAALAWTHGDSSTAVRSDNRALARLANRHGALSLVDGICAAGAEPFNQDQEGVDVYLAASPKALSVPAGLILLTVSPRAMGALERRQSPPLIYSLDLRRWGPVFAEIEAGRFAYFNTPATSLVLALSVGLKQILEEGIQRRWERHARLASAIRAAACALGLEIVASEDVRSNALTVLRYPKGVGRELVGMMKAEGVLIAGGYHPTLGPETFRIGHLGWVSEADVLATVGALERVLCHLGVRSTSGKGMTAAQEGLNSPPLVSFS